MKRKMQPGMRLGKGVLLPISPVGVRQGACESLVEKGMRDGECIYECDSV
jgi:hypothetical protein